MAFRLNEGNGTAYYEIGVLDSGQVTGLTDAEIVDTLLVLFHITTTFEP
jgi:GTPase